MRLFAITRLFGITKEGLLAISFSVVVLWGCLALEQVVVRKAGKDYRTSQQTLARLREQAPPASQPAQPFRSHRPAVS